MENQNNNLEMALEGMQNEAVNFGSRFIKDDGVRERYSKLIAKNARAIRQYAQESGNFAEAAEMANHFRNTTMNSIREATSDVGRVLAFKVKPVGRTLDFMLDAASEKLYYRSFSALDDITAQRQVFLEVIESAGRSNSRVTAAVAKLGKVGRGLVVVTAGIAIYEVATAQDPMREVAKQGTSLGLGYGLSVAGGWAGLACGPAAFACVPLGVFVGGALGAVAAEYLYD